MAKKRFLQARPFLALGIVVVIWLILPFAVKALGRVSFYEFQAPANVVVSYGRDLQDYWALRVKSRNELIEAGQNLAQANARYELTIRENQALLSQLQRLEQLLTLPVREGFRYEYARVVRRDFSGWWQQLVIRKGRNFGIQVGDPVVFIGGVVGRVREVNLYTSVVDLVSSQNVRLAANFEGDNRQVAYRGGVNAGFAQPRGLVEFVPQDLTANIGRPVTLVTSGMGGVFPAGLPIGKVALLRTAVDGQFKVGEVILDERLSAIAEVAVLIRETTNVEVPTRTP